MFFFSSPDSTYFLLLLRIFSWIFLRCLTKHCQKNGKMIPILNICKKKLIENFRIYIKSNREFFIFERLWWRCALATMKAYQCTHLYELWIILTSQGLLKESNDLSDRSEQTLEVSDSSDCPSIDDLMFLLGLLKCSPVLFWK